MPADDLIERLELGSRVGVTLSPSDCGDVLARLTTTRVQCEACGRLVRARETAGGRCAGCLLRERDEAMAEAGRLVEYAADLTQLIGRDHDGETLTPRADAITSVRRVAAGLGPGPGEGEGA